jgi:hypothetical protein
MDAKRSQAARAHTKEKRKTSVQRENPLATGHASARRVSCGSARSMPKKGSAKRKREEPEEDVEDEETMGCGSDKKTGSLYDLCECKFMCRLISARRFRKGRSKAFPASCEP